MNVYKDWLTRNNLTLIQGAKELDLGKRTVARYCAEPETVPEVSILALAGWEFSQGNRKQATLLCELVNKLKKKRIKS